MAAVSFIHPPISSLQHPLPGWRTRGGRRRRRMIHSVLAEERFYPRHSNHTSCSHLARHRCSRVGRRGVFDPPRLPTTRLAIHNKTVAHLHGHPQGGGKGAKLTETSVDLISRDEMVPPPENKKKNPARHGFPYIQLR